MAGKLTQLVRPYRSVSLIGMCKNAGKTTALNRLIRDAARDGICLGLTSIGRDGEGKDLVTGTKKPGIYVPEGTLIATADQLVLRCSDITREILDTTGIFTPMGQVVLLRARSDGSVELAGPSMTAQLASVREDFFRRGAQQVIIDGALSRKSLCSRRVSDATVLCTGASYHKDLHTVVSDTAYQCRLLTLPETEDSRLQALEETDDRRCQLLCDGELRPADEGKGLDVTLRQEQPQAVFFGGALTDLTLRPLIASNVKLEGLCLVVRDASRLLLKADTFEKLLRRGARLQVCSNVNLTAVTVNPFSAYGFHMDGARLLEQLQARVDVPVINVMEDMP